MAKIGPLALEVGQRARRTQTVTTREVELYAQITGDRNPLHFDADFAARTRSAVWSRRAASRRACSMRWSPWTCPARAPCS